MRRSISSTPASANSTRDSHAPDFRCGGPLTPAPTVPRPSRVNGDAEPAIEQGTKSAGQPDGANAQQRSFVECTPGDWRAPPPTTKLLTIIRGRGRLSTEGRGAGRDASDITAASDHRVCKGNPRSAEPAHVTVPRRFFFLVDRAGRAAARGLGADFSRTTLATAPIPERIHQLHQLSQIRRAGGAEVLGLSH